MATYWTNNAGTGIANNASNWDNGLPTSTNGAIFDTTKSNANCAWNITGTVEFIILSNGYSGTVTLSNDIIAGTATSSANNLFESGKFALYTHTLTLGTNTDITTTNFEGDDGEIAIGDNDVFLLIQNSSATLTVDTIRLAGTGNLGISATYPPVNIETNNLIIQNDLFFTIYKSATYLKITGSGSDGMLITDGNIVSSESTVTWSLWFVGGAGAGTQLIQNALLQGMAISFKDDATVNFEDTTLEIEEFFNLEGGPTIEFTNCILKSNDENLWYFSNWEEGTSITWIDSVCEGFQDSIHYRTTGSGDFTTRLDFPEGIHKYRTIPNTKVITHQIQGSLTARKYPISKERMVEFAIFVAIDDTNDVHQTLWDIFKRRDWFAFTFYDEILSKCMMLEEPMVTYQDAHYREIRVLLGEML